MIKSDSIANLTKALIKAKKNFNTIVKDSDNPFFKSKYADLVTVIEATESALSEAGLTVSQFPHNDGNSVGVLTIILHESGEFLQHEFALPLTKHDAQTGTAAITYARRSALKAVLGVAEEDDDGNTASAPAPAPKSTARPNNPPQNKQIAEAFDPPAKTASVPKAEIPNEQKSGSATQTNSVSDPSLPTPEELNAYRSRFGKLIDALSTAGLKPSKGFPIQNKVKAYLLKFTGKDNPNNVTKGEWDGFFESSTAICGGTEGIKGLVDRVNLAIEEKQ